MYSECEKKFVKSVGAFIHGKWFCSEGCSDLDPETKQLKELYTKGLDFENKPIDEEDGVEDGEIDL